MGQAALTWTQSAIFCAARMDSAGPGEVRSAKCEVRSSVPTKRARFRHELKERTFVQGRHKPRPDRKREVLHSSASQGRVQAKGRVPWHEGRHAWTGEPPSRLLRCMACRWRMKGEVVCDKGSVRLAAGVDACRPSPASGHTTCLGTKVRTLCLARRGCGRLLAQKFALCGPPVLDRRRFAGLLLPSEQVAFDVPCTGRKYRVQESSSVGLPASLLISSKPFDGQKNHAHQRLSQGKVRTFVLKARQSANFCGG